MAETRRGGGDGTFATAVGACIAGGWTSDPTTQAMRMAVGKGMTSDIGAHGIWQDVSAR